MTIKMIKPFVMLLSLSVVVACGTKSRKSTMASPYNVTGKDTISLASGLKYILIEEGKGQKPETGKTVSVHYTGYLTDGKKFDSSIDRGEPIAFPIGTGKVIQGWDEGILLLNTGSKARLIIPHELGYGVAGYPPVIPPSSTLIFDVELVGVE
jgi:FKBP-type peptidyl-prolyl cis-trans isomerase